MRLQANRMSKLFGGVSAAILLYSLAFSHSTLTAVTAVWFLVLAVAQCDVVDRRAGKPARVTLAGTQRL